MTTSPFIHDLNTPAGRRLAFNERIDELTGKGMTFNAALEKMRETPDDAELLTKMGDYHKLDPKHAAPHRGGALPHLWTPEARRERFNELIDHLMAPEKKGGHGLTFDQAIQHLRDNKDTADLIAAMGSNGRDELPAANASSAGAAGGVAYGLAINIAPQMIGAGEWLKLSPWFEGDYYEKEGMNWKKYRQVVRREHGDRIVAAFNALRATMGERFRGLPIYRGHPDADPQRWPDERRLGAVMDVEARGDGLYVKAQWNDDGEKNRAQGYLVYPSPAWPYDLQIKSRSGRIEPIELRSIGMTNTPRIGEVPAWTNSQTLS